MSDQRAGNYLDPGPSSAAWGIYKGEGGKMCHLEPAPLDSPLGGSSGEVQHSLGGPIGMLLFIQGLLLQDPDTNRVSMYISLIIVI